LTTVQKTSFPAVSLWSLCKYGFGQTIGYGTDLAIFFVVMTLVHSSFPVVAHICGKFGSGSRSRARRQVPNRCQQSHIR
jgi:hypothetical protein